MKVGVVGASGYAGVELLRLCASHPELEVVVAGAGTAAGQAVAAHTPSLAAAYPSLAFGATDPADLDGLDAVFLALPHGESQHLVPEIENRVGVVVDLAADFRLKDPSLYPTWYGHEHTAPDLLARFRYGLPELFRDDLRGATFIAAPGCYPTAASLALAPLLRAGVVAPTGIVVDAASGVSGAGRPPRPTFTSARWTRTSWPTGCSTTGTRPRWSRTSAPRCSSPLTWRRWCEGSWPPVMPARPIPTGD